LASQHGGRVTAEEGGAVFQIRLPLTQTTQGGDQEVSEYVVAER